MGLVGSLEEAAIDPGANSGMALSRDHELSDPGRVVHLSGMLKKELEHAASTRGLPTPALQDFSFNADPLRPS